jgi:hypothetical protein
MLHDITENPSNILLRDTELKQTFFRKNHVQKVFQICDHVIKVLSSKMPRIE